MIFSTFTTYCIVDEEKIILKSIFGSKVLNWKDVKDILLSENLNNNNVRLYLLTETDRVSNVSNEAPHYKYKIGTTMSISYEYKAIYKAIYANVKDIEQLIIDDRFIDFCSKG